ncbi:HK97 gp10 family phage protein [Tessaracoccus sp. MC1627]|uniref:HK97 gp10 family phage protein n=1 Tax=Tessaracoccus sp. MC1627 TaxID=2760312 RepID=UPI001602705C|nr:HK97 gp10 family phage protein [Tessaracoccus sp. MC1627]MBB1511974.1 HK97 gp10 family phage protein [Tessaracoccus sp. MC1627]
MVKVYDAKLTQIEQAAQAAMVETAKEVLRVAKSLAPKESGKLRRSGKVETDFKSVSVVFKGRYAWIQHERLDFKHPNGGQAKYLEAAVEQSGAKQKIADGVRVRLK